MPLLPTHHDMTLTSKNAISNYTLAHLPEDLLAHVLRFTTASLRRDGHPGRPASVRHLRYAGVSPAFRRAFLRHLHAVVFDHPASARLAQLNWGCLSACIALRKIVVARSAGLNDTQLLSLFSLLSGRCIFIRDFELTLSEDVTAISLVALADYFGPYLTRLQVTLVADPRSPDGNSASVNHPLPGTNAVGNGDVEHVLLPPAQGLMGQPANAPLPAGPIQIENPGIANELNVNGWDFGNNAIAGPPMNAAAFHMQLLNNHNTPQGSIDRAVQVAAHMSRRDKVLEGNSVSTGDNVPIYTVSSRADYDAVEVFAKELGIHPAFACNITELLCDLTPRFLQPGQFHQNGVPDDTIVSNNTLIKVLPLMPNLVDLALIRTKYVSDNGVKAILDCPLLEKLQLCNLPKVTDNGLADVLKSLPKLRALSLSKMQSVGDKSIRSLVRGESKNLFESLKLVMMDRISDPVIQFLVNGCESLKSVIFMYCFHITDTAASHVSCSRNIETVVFCPYATSQLSCRAVVHLACASVNLRSLTLGNCLKIGLRGIAAMANLPGLRKLHMGGLGALSLDIMKSLGAFSRLENLLLQGELYLTDLGVKLLCGQRGHRFINLVLADSTNQMTDDALDCIMTWCTSLRTLEVCGSFKPGVLGRLHDAIPHADIRVFAANEDVGGFVEGNRCVWD